MPANLENSAVAIRLEKNFISIPKAVLKMFKLPHSCTHFGIEVALVLRLLDLPSSLDLVFLQVVLRELTFIFYPSHSHFDHLYSEHMFSSKSLHCYSFITFFSRQYRMSQHIPNETNPTFDKFSHFYRNFFS